MSERKLRAWEGAGLIDAATAARIREWEASHARPLALWAVVGLAALAIGLGVISVVAANWDAIPGGLRLALHFALLAASAGGLAMPGRALAERHPWFHEAALFTFGMLGMTFLGHLGQVYQTDSPLWQPLALWLVLFAPVLLTSGLSWLAAAMIMGTLVFTLWAHAEASSAFSAKDVPAALRWAAETGAPVLVAGLAARMRKSGAREEFWRRMEQLALAYAVSGASLIVIASAFDRWPAMPEAPALLAYLLALALIAALAAVWTWHEGDATSGRGAAGVLGASGLAVVLAYGLSDSDLAAGALFMALWAGVAAAGLHAGWRGAFQFAVAVVALRLVILSFELAGDLLTSGAGLIVSGLLILAIAWAALRVSRRFAPGKEISA